MNAKRLCLVHGWGAGSQKLEPLKEELQKLDWEIFLPKLPFFDLPEPKTPWQLEDFCRYLDDKAREFFKNKPYSLFGHSFGGRIGLKMALENKNQAKLNSLILCATAGISRNNRFKRFFFKTAAKGLSPLKNLSPDAYRLLEKVGYRLAGAGDYKQITSVTKKETFKNIVEESLKPKTKQIKIPTLILWGGKDKTTPVTDAYFLKKTIVNSTLKIFPNEDHRLPYNQPKNLAQEIDRWFLSL
ncbi:MAG TPA: alpha/beta hydrolase [Candidatus Woesebacteria bacterium]|nr:alpha/beta hydrolase [Candidatus Woesebacteria bacterium]